MTFIPTDRRPIAGKHGYTCGLISLRLTDS